MYKRTETKNKIKNKNSYIQSNAFNILSIWPIIKNIQPTTSMIIMIAFNFEARSSVTWSIMALSITRIKYYNVRKIACFEFADSLL